MGHMPHPGAAGSGDDNFQCPTKKCKGLYNTLAHDTINNLYSILVLAHPYTVSGSALLFTIYVLRRHVFDGCTRVPK